MLFRSLELGAFKDWRPSAIGITTPGDDAGVASMGRLRESYRMTALRDAARRAADHFRCPVQFLDAGSPAVSMGHWAHEHQLDEVVAYAPFVGPCADLAPQICSQLVARGVRWTLARRSWDAERFPHARTGFFPFWAKLGHGLRRQGDLQPTRGSNQDARRPQA